MNPKLEQWTRYAILVLMIAAAVGIFACVANGQTSTIGAMPDTVDSLDFIIPVSVDPPNGDLVGVYWRVVGETGWVYAGWGAEEITWTAPMDNIAYQFYSQVDPEPYRKTPMAEVFVCSTCGDCPDCPPLSTLELVSTLAVRGFQMEPNEPNIGWHWLHATTGTDPIKFEVEWDVGGSVSFIDSVAVSDTTFSEVDLPYTWGTYQLVRVRGVDAGQRVGPWSIWSQRWDDAGPPGAPGQPQGYLKMVGP